MSVLAKLMLVIILGLASPARAAGLSGGQLLITPNTLTFQVSTPPAVGTAAVTVQVIIRGRLPWRLTVLALGPLQSGDGSEIPVSHVTWQGSPGPTFVNGALSSNHPQLLARGEGPKVGVVRFFLKNSWDLAEGRYRQRLMFTLSSP
jgi:hypothetical protein